MLKNLYTYLFIDDLIDPSALSISYTGNVWKMKLRRDVAYLTLLSYFLLIFNPVMPIIADKMAHTFWEEYHLITVHGVYGTGHVKAELDKSEKQTDKEKAPGSNQADSESYVHLLASTTIDFSSYHYITTLYPSHNFHIPASYPDIDYLPPEA